MRTLDEIVAIATAGNVRLRINSDALSHVASVSPDSLFQVPLLALTILVIVRARRSTGLQSSDVSTWTLGTLVRHFASLQLARGRIQWSVHLRKRCADALIFLEDASLIAIREQSIRVIFPTADGLNFVRKQTAKSDGVGALVRDLARSYRAVDMGGLELL